MASGDAQKVWFAEMIETLRKAWYPAMPVEALLCLRDRLEQSLETIRRERNIQPAMMWCPGCKERHRAAPPRVTAHATIMALARFAIASEAEVKSLEKRWNSYRRHHQLDSYGKKTEAVSHRESGP